VERAPRILIALLKAHGIRNIIASPGTTNMAFIASVQGDPFFKIYSSVDERSAAYMACGMAAESGKPVVISCTGATASRNYMPGLTEAYYRKLPVLAITSTTVLDSNGNLTPQKVDRSVSPNDVYRFKCNIRIIHSEQEAWLANTQINTAILALTHKGGGPAHINLETDYSNRYEYKELPEERVINRITPSDVFPKLLREYKVAVFIGSHKTMSHDLKEAIDSFCLSYNAVVIGDLTSGYNGKYKVNSSLICSQTGRCNLRKFDVVIHIGEVSGDYYSSRIVAKEVWRVSQDGEIRDLWHSLRYVFEMQEELFFTNYSDTHISDSSLLEQCEKECQEIIKSIPSLPFSHIWIAQQTAHKFPKRCIVHFGILNTLRSWNFFSLSEDIETYCNVGGFGIDGIVSTLIGASLIREDKICFAILGDLAFFYDLNSMANRHVGNNVRIMLVNNGRGVEFTNYSHPGYVLGEQAIPFVAAGGHFGNKSLMLVKHFAEDLGFEYLTASNKEEYLNAVDRFLTSEITDKPMIFEVFTDSKDESDALEIMLNLKTDTPSKSTLKSTIKNGVRSVLGDKA
ncbi:MAG: 2-succinyl-5-enolpyruvyl-6-hydroxy-3-cyclohexene-1-carboxylate synthase, partial [Lactobacillus sp.]|nr:2-succinyl-5-enolpyruvyl-6-hydroxy-3-cyclohexene-1-carboxylate synthase [Lactobacillus sp.]